MALIVVTGPLGSGKSFYAVRKAVDALERDKVVITNFRMSPDWHERVVDRHPLRWLIPGRRKRLKARWRRNVLTVSDLDTLLRVRVDGDDESRAVAIIDEAHMFLNAREWKDKGRMDLVGWASASRKLGFDVYLVTQDLQSLDRQVRDRLTYHVKLTNLKQFKVVGIPIVPFNFFQAIWVFHGAGKSVVKREWYRLNWMAKLYDTMATGGLGMIDEPDDPIRLPTPPPVSPSPATSAASASSAAGAAARRPDPLDASRRRLLEIGADSSDSESASRD
jgi:adenosyl cobinamide kinase/adenosyl cobinamide phosphate guanylyltransferase